MWLIFPGASRGVCECGKCNCLNGFLGDNCGQRNCTSAQEKCIYPETGVSHNIKLFPFERTFRYRNFGTLKNWNY